MNGEVIVFKGTKLNRGLYGAVKVKFVAADLKLPLKATGRDRLRGGGCGRKELLSLSRAVVPLESSLVETAGSSR